jgi:hypothetical protein
MSRSALKSRLTQPQIDALIPGGPVSSAQAQHASIQYEALAETAQGDPLVMRQRKLTPVDKLRAKGLIGEPEVKAAQAFKKDFDDAYQTCTNVLAVVHVDSCGAQSGIVEAKFRQVRAAQRFHGALRHLGNQLSIVALRGIIATEADRKVGAVFQALGMSALVTSDRNLRYGAGMATLVIALRELAIQKGYRKPDPLPGFGSI